MFRLPGFSIRLALVPFGGAVASLLLVACGSGGSDAPVAVATPRGPAATATVQPVAVIKISDNKFEPAELRIKVGTKVQWEWSGSNPHSVLISGSASEQKTGSGTFVQDFRAAGSAFPYQCGVHGAAMAGRIIVE